MKVLILTNLYPIKSRPYQHSFVRDEARLISGFSDVRVVNCLPFKPSLLFNKGESTDYLKDDNIAIESAVYLSVPRRRLPGITGTALRQKIGKNLDESRPDVMHTHFLYPCGLAIPEAKKRDIPTVLTIHGVDWYNSVNIPSLKRKVDEIMESVDRIICVGPRLEYDVAKAYPEASEKIQTLLHGIDFDFFKPPESPKPESSRIRMLCVARFVHKKGLHLLIDAISKSDQLKKSCSLDILGDKTDMDYYHRIRKQIDKLSSDSIQIHPPVGKEKLLEFYQNADFYVQPSLDEPFGLSLLEAIACGLPAVALSSGGPDVIITEGNGFLVQSPDGLQKALEKMCLEWDSYTYEQLHKSVKSRFDSSIKQEKLQGIYLTISDF